VVRCTEPLIRDLRLARGWSQDDLATALNAALPEATMTRSLISRYESEKRLPTSVHLIDALSRVLDVPIDVVQAETRLSRVERRTFLSLAALTAAHGKLAGEIYSSIAGHDSGPLATVQTTHGTDLVIGSLVKPPAVRKLSVWKDIITTYDLPAEMNGTGEIVDGTPHLHVNMAVEGDRAVSGHLHRAQIGTWFARVYVMTT
jgi:transcriptional regulator with XRE-family HTH domain